MQYIQFESDQLTQCGNVRIIEPCHRCQPILWDNEILTSFNTSIFNKDYPIVFARPILDSTAETIKLMYRVSTSKVLLEYDDAIWNVQTYKDADSNTLNECERVAKMNVELMRYHCHGIVVSTRVLAERASQITNKPIIIMPNGVSYKKPTLPRTKTILYTGNGSRNKDVTNNWVEAINHMRTKGYKCISTCDKIADIPFNRCNFHEFNDSVNDIAPEYYIAPLHKSYLNDGRSNLKELEAWKIGAKFVGQGTPYRNSLPYDATTEDIIKAFETASIPTFDDRYNLNSREYAERFVTTYTGEWICH